MVIIRYLIELLLWMHHSIGYEQGVSADYSPEQSLGTPQTYYNIRNQLDIFSQTDGGPFSKE